MHTVFVDLKGLEPLTSSMPSIQPVPIHGFHGLVEIK